MVDIIYRVGIKAPIAQVYRALSTVEGVAGWWTRQTTGASGVGDSMNVDFHSPTGERVGGMTMQVTALDPGRNVQWLFTAGPDEWIGTEAHFALAQDGDYTIVLFKHAKWREAVEFTAHCSTKWGVFMLSLKDLVETGTGKPSPVDVKIDNWN